MSREIIREWNFWLASMAAGVCMAFSYDLIRLFRRLVKHGRMAVDLEDIVYWTACFLLSFTLLYYGNNGVIRFAAVLGAAAGMLLYAVTLGRFFVKTIFFLIDNTIGRLLRLLVKIIKKIPCLLRPVKRIAMKVYRKKLKFVTVQRRTLHSAAKSVRKRSGLKFGLFQKCRLTKKGFEHRIKKGKVETKYGKSKAKQKKAKKNAGVSPIEK